MKIFSITDELDRLAPPALAESYDNVGLLVGEREQELSGALLCLELTDAVIDEAKSKHANLVIAHHPIWFGARKKLIGEDYVSRLILRAIREKIGLYAIHTNLDNIQQGVNRKIGEKLGLQNLRILQPRPGTLMTLTLYTSVEIVQEVVDRVKQHCAGLEVLSYHYYVQDHNADFVLKQSGINLVDELAAHQREMICLTLQFPFYLLNKIENLLVELRDGNSRFGGLFFTINSLENHNTEIGAGMIGEFREPLSKQAFLEKVKRTFNCKCIRFTDAPLEAVKRVAFCGGAGSSLISDALRKKADAFLTGDITYHKFFDNENKMLLLDIGHYESEQFTAEIMFDYLTKKFPKTNIYLSNINTNPVQYYT